MAWTLAWRGVTGAIVGARSPEQVDGWLAAATLELTDEDLDEIAEAIRRSGAEAGRSGRGAERLKVKTKGRKYERAPPPGDPGGGVRHLDGGRVPGAQGSAAGAGCTISRWMIPNSLAVTSGWMRMLFWPTGLS